ncbi:MAG: hypothetical protein KGZ86_06325 [Candidatus Latescibacteria bacterium]|nr:hypothetical protein [Candidatus Latescibacterota bacterium]
MSCLSSGIFWGVLIVVIGILVLIRVIFGVQIPILSLIIGLLLIYFGVRIITGMSCCRRPRTVVFEEKHIRGTAAQEKYDVVFGKSTIDLTSIELKPGMNKVEINTIFGNSIIKIDPAMPVKIRASAVFGSARLPDGSTTAFGDYTYQTDTLKHNESKDYLLIKLDVVFGSAEIVTR